LKTKKWINCLVICIAKYFVKVKNNAKNLKYLRTTEKSKLCFTNILRMNILLYAKIYYCFKQFLFLKFLVKSLSVYCKISVTERFCQKWPRIYVVVITIRFFPHSWLITGSVTSVTWRLLEHELLTLPVNLRSSRIVSGVLIAWSLVVCVVFCRSLIVLFPLYCLTFLRFVSFGLPIWYIQTFLSTLSNVCSVCLFWCRYNMRCKNKTVDVLTYLKRRYINTDIIS
jgi:hypothetical protein